MTVTYDDILIEPQPAKETELLLSGDKVFATIQGEGPARGHPATFVRLAACNLRCGVNGGWKCDSAYTWDWTGLVGPAYDPNAEVFHTPITEVLAMVRESNPRLVVITGGEPLLQDKALAQLIAPLHNEGRTIHMETNGTRQAVHCAPYMDLFVVSPKLRNSGNYDQAREIHPSWRLRPRVAFKFVIREPSDVDEVLRVIGPDVHSRDVWLMPEGVTPEVVANGMRMLAPICQAYGFNLTGRDHITLWGDTRGT